MKALQVNLKADDEAEIYVYDAIGQSMWSDGVTALSVKDALKQAKGAKTVSVRINSPGGDAFEGVAIYNLLRSSGSRVVTYNDGLAASAASIVQMAGKQRMAGRGTQTMIHNAMTMAYGDANEMRRQADTLDGISKEIATIYESVTGLPIDKILSMMDDETWFTPEEAMENGFATEVTEPRNVQACAVPEWIKFKRRPQWANIVEPAQETFEQAVERQIAEMRGNKHVA